MVLMRTNFVVNTAFKLVKPFIHPVTMAKFMFLGNSYTKELLEIINADNLPIEYGGTAPNIDWLNLQLKF